MAVYPVHLEGGRKEQGNDHTTRKAREAAYEQTSALTRAKSNSNSRERLTAGADALPITTLLRFRDYKRRILPLKPCNKFPMHNRKSQKGLLRTGRNNMLKRREVIRNGERKCSRKVAARNNKLVRQGVGEIAMQSSDNSD